MHNLHGLHDQALLCCGVAPNRPWAALCDRPKVWGVARCGAASSSQNGYGGLAKVMGIAHHLEPKWLRTAETQGPCPVLRGFCIKALTVLRNIG